MRLNNKHKAGYYHFASTALIMLFLAGVVLFILERYKYHYLGYASFLFIIVPVLFLVIFYIRGRQIFEYDGDGEALNFKNRNVILFLDKSLSDEFPKYKMLNYEVLNFYILKRLYVKISSSKSNVVILKYDISYLTKKEVNDLKFSLNKVVKANQENKREKNN